nr:amino acid ABC transporter permease [Aerococcus urinaehominis]
MPSLLNGLKLTVLIFVVVLLLSIPLGFIIAIFRVFGPKWLQAIIEMYVFIMRGSPLMLQLMVVFFGLPFIGVTMDRLPAALFAFVINYAAYFTEIFRGGIASVPKGQFESISVLGIGRLRGFRRIILPQVMRIVMPSVGNEVVALVKDTSLVYVIGLGELLRAGSIAANNYASLLPYLAVGVIYLIMTAIVTLFLKQIESKTEW